jgi:ribosomal protein S12 methylthiotransferase
MSETQLRVFIAGNQVCMKRGMDAERMKRYLYQNGCKNVNKLEDADLVVAITCAFISSYVQTAVDMILELKRHRGRLIVAGCLPAMAPEKFRSVFTGDHILTRDFEDLDRLFPNFTVPYSKIPDAIIPDMNVMKPFCADGFSPIAVRNNISKNAELPAILRISKGCNNSCSYCSHPAALGPLKSKPLVTCIQDYQRILAEGHLRLSIHANDPGAYGLDIGSSYPELLYRLNEITDSPDVKWSLLDISPHWLIKYRERILEILKWNRVVFIGVPIQSGSPRILKRMHRSVRVFEVIETLQEFKRIAPDLSIATHLIAGFPGETREDTEMSIDIFRKAKIDIAYIFKFSSNFNTKSAKFVDSLPSKQIAEIQTEMAYRISDMNVGVETFS